MTDRDDKLGWVLTGCLTSIFFFGFNSYQTLSYFRSYWSDPVLLKILVLVIWLLELGHGNLAGYLVYIVFVKNFADYDAAIAETYLKLSLTGFVSVGITTLVQWYFAFRLYKLSSSKLVPIVSATFSLMRLICYLGAGAYRQNHHVQTEVWKRTLFSVGILSILTDILMAIKLSICLWKRREKGGELKRLSSWYRFPFTTVDSIILVSIQANAFTCIVTTITVILTSRSSDDCFAWMAMSLVASRLFAISFLSSLIAGKRLSPQTEPTTASAMFPNNSPMILPTVTERSFVDTEPMSCLESSGPCYSPPRASSRISLVPTLQIRSEESSPSSPVT